MKFIVTTNVKGGNYWLQSYQGPSGPEWNLNGLKENAFVFPMIQYARDTILLVQYRFKTPLSIETQ